MRLVLHDSPDPAIRARLFAAIDAFNDASTGRLEPAGHLAIVLRDAAGAIEGGLVGISYYDWMIVEMLLVPEGLRGHGLGTRLMRAAEAVAVRRGCKGVWLDTASEAAEAFYRRIGYRGFAALADHPRGNARYFMSKSDLRAGETGGLEVHEAVHREAAAVIGRGLGAVADGLFGPDPGRATLAIVAEDGVEKGGLWMVARRGWMFLDLFILDPEARRGGTGGAILAMAEREARRLGCVGVWLDTYGFQAPGFYARHGYRQFGELAEYPAPWGRHFMMKRFERDQGEA